MTRGILSDADLSAFENMQSGSDNRTTLILFFFNLKTLMKPRIKVLDTNFLAYLRMNYPEIIKDDSIITNSIEIRNITKLNIPNLNIADLTGIEAFTALTNLYCCNNQLTSLDVAANTALTYLYCFNNQSNTYLTHLYCDNNQLTNLDISANTAFISLA